LTGAQKEKGDEAVQKKELNNIPNARAGRIRSRIYYQEVREEKGGRNGENDIRMRKDGIKKKKKRTILTQYSQAKAFGGTSKYESRCHCLGKENRIPKGRRGRKADKRQRQIRELLYGSGRMFCRCGGLRQVYICKDLKRGISDRRVDKNCFGLG